MYLVALVEYYWAIHRGKEYAHAQHTGKQAKPVQIHSVLTVYNGPVTLALDAFMFRPVVVC